MIVAAHPHNEVERISSLYEYNILDTVAESEYDDITRIAQEVCNASGSLIGLIDNDRQWFKSKVGLDADETERDLTFCSHAILEPNKMMIVPDSRQDERFFDSPFVTTSDSPVYFYAGVPLVNKEGAALGTLCIIDNKPRELTNSQKETLLALSRQIVAYMEVRRVNIALSKQKTELEQVNKELERFSYVVAHDIKSPCASLVMASAFLKEMAGDVLNEEGTEMLDMMVGASDGIIKMVDGILKHTKTVNKEDIVKERFSFGQLIKDLKHMVTVPSGFSFSAGSESIQLYTSRYILMQILLNLCNNAIKYNDKPNGQIMVLLEETGTHYKFTVADNGRGIDAANHAAIFDLFTTVGGPDRDNKSGHGIGLATVKRLVNKMDGNIELVSHLGEGSTFVFTLHK